MMATIAELADKYPPKDTFVPPEGVEYTLIHQIAEQTEKYKMPVLDFTEGDLGELADALAEMEHEPDGSFRKGIGAKGTMVMCKMPTFQAIGVAREPDGMQPLLRMLRLAGAAVFHPPRFDT